MPIIKLKDREKSFETDISVENWTSVRNAFVLKCFSECDPRVETAGHGNQTVGSKSRDN